MLVRRQSLQTLDYRRNWLEWNFYPPDLLQHRWRQFCASLGISKNNTIIKWNENVVINLIDFTWLSRFFNSGEVCRFDFFNNCTWPRLSHEVNPNCEKSIRLNWKGDCGSSGMGSSAGRPLILNTRNLNKKKALVKLITVCFLWHYHWSFECFW